MEKRTVVSPFSRKAEEKLDMVWCLIRVERKDKRSFARTHDRLLVQIRFSRGRLRTGRQQEERKAKQ